MACRKIYNNQINNINKIVEPISENKQSTEETTETINLLFGVDSKVPANGMLQNNLTLVEWVTRNKKSPVFWGRNIVGEGSLTKAEIEFLHRQGCKVAALYEDEGDKLTEAQGEEIANKAAFAATNLKIPEGAGIFLVIGENESITRDFMRGFAKILIAQGYTPAFRANTDAKFSFDREFSRGMQTDTELFKQCFVWATAPDLKEYYRVTTTHLLHPDEWKPFAPSCITRGEIAAWQYGRECHPIRSDSDKEVTFNVNLIKNERIVMVKMF